MIHDFPSTKIRCRRAIAIAMIVASWSSAGLAQEPAPKAAISPDGNVRIEVLRQPAGDLRDVPHYRVTAGDTEIVGPSRLGFKLADGSALGGPCDVVGFEERRIREDYTQITGKRREVSARAAEVVIRLRERTAPRRMWEVVLRAYDDGTAFRYRFPRQDGWTSLAIENELTEFRLPSDARAFALPLNSFTTSHEKRYSVQRLKELPKQSLLGLPLLVQRADGMWTAITEADVNEYAGMYLSPSGNGALISRLSPLPKEPNVAVRAELPHISPWRVIMVSPRIGRLVESDLVLNLSAPCAIADTSWIKTGKSTFPWWNGYYEEKVGFKPGLNTATMKHYIDFCAETGIPYHSLDGTGNTAWYGGPITPYEGAEPSKGVAGLDVQEVLAYAKAKGVRIRLWMHWGAAAAHMEKTFPLYKKWGIEGVMLDFMDRDDQEMNRFVRKAVALAAENNLTVTLHGCPKPTGLERTYPNLLTHEGVMNLEYDKWDKTGITADHELIVPFTRMLAGPLDFHQGSFRTVKPAEFKPRDIAPLVIGTPARTLASYVVYQNHMPMVVDYPSAYRGHPALPALVAIPTTWDDTKVLDADVGKLVVLARRSGRDWHIGAMTDQSPRTLRVPLRQLGRTEWNAEMWQDDDGAKAGVVRRDTSLRDGDELILKLGANGGAYVKLTPRSR